MNIGIYKNEFNRFIPLSIIFNYMLLNVSILQWTQNMQQKIVLRNGYLLGHNADLFWLVSTYVVVMIFQYPQIVIGLGTAGVPVPPCTPGTQKSAEVNCCLCL